MQTMNLHQKSGVIIVFIIFTLAILFFVVSLPVTISPPPFLPLFDVLFIYFTSAAVVYLAVLAWLRGNSRTVLLLAIGVLVAGSTAVIGELFFLLSVNPLLIGAVVSIGSLLGSFVHFVNLILTTVTTHNYREPARKVKILISYFVVILLTLFLMMIGLRGETLNIQFPGSVLSVLPPPVELGVIIFCGVAGIFFLRLYAEEQSPMLFWYSLGLLLIALADFSTLIQERPYDLVSWTGRSAAYIANVYLVSAVLAAYRGRSVKKVPDTSGS